MILDKLTALPDSAKICFEPIDATLPGATMNSAPMARIDIGEIMTRLQNREGDPDAIVICCGLGGSMTDIVPSLIAALRASVTEPVFGLVTLPCTSEGERRAAKAADDIDAISPLLDGTILFDNETWEKKVAGRRDALVKELSQSSGFLGLGKNAPKLTPQEITQKLLNQNIVKRINLILKAGEFKADGGIDLAEVVMDSSEILNTMMGMGYITIGYAVENLHSSPRPFLSRLHKTNEAEEQRKSAERIIELAKHAIYNEVSIPCDMTSAAKALVLVAGPSHEISMKGFMTVRKWIDRSIAGMETRSGDYPVTNNKYVAIIVMLSGIENIPRVNEIKEIRDRLRYGESRGRGPVRGMENKTVLDPDRYATIVTNADTMAWQPPRESREPGPRADASVPRQQLAYGRPPAPEYIPRAEPAPPYLRGRPAPPVDQMQYIPPPQPVARPARGYPDEQRRVIREQPVVQQEPVRIPRQVPVRQTPTVGQPVQPAPRQRVIPQEYTIPERQVRRQPDIPAATRQGEPQRHRSLESGYEAMPVARRSTPVNREAVTSRRERTVPGRDEHPAEEPARSPQQTVRIQGRSPVQPSPQRQPVYPPEVPEQKTVIRHVSRHPRQQEYVPAEPDEEPVREARVVRMRRTTPAEEAELPANRIPEPDATLPHLQDSYKDLANPDKSDTVIQAQLTEGAQIGLKGRAQPARDDIFFGKNIPAKKPSLVRDDALLHASIKTRRPSQTPQADEETGSGRLVNPLREKTKKVQEKTVDDDLSWIND
jgi:cell division GTPase FtsZ